VTGQAGEAFGQFGHERIGQPDEVALRVEPAQKVQCAGHRAAQKGAAEELVESFDDLAFLGAQ
jgi:hypothetical protein